MINGTTRVLGLIGNPVEHSMSPMIHNEIARRMNIDAAYVTFKVENDIMAAVKGAYNLNILGMNVTVPHKENVIKTLVDIDDAAAKIGAVNTLVRTGEGYKGYNTDILGIKRELSDNNIEIKDKTVVILGAGGAARAIATLMAISGASKIYVLNRTVDKAVALCKEVANQCDYDSIVAMAISDYKDITEDEYVVIQTTSVGLYPNVTMAPITDEEFYKKATSGVDIIYNPFETMFMKLMKEQGKPAFNGLWMLVYQAVAAFELWENVTVDDDTIKAVYELVSDSLVKKNEG